jgi:hypothetical protein
MWTLLGLRLERLEPLQALGEAPPATEVVAGDSHGDAVAPWGAAGCGIGRLCCLNPA